MDDKTVFQSTPPRRRRLSSTSLFVRVLLFSIHASAKEATGDTFCISFLCTIFNPRLREGGDFYCLRYKRSDLFSIHASAKEATGFGSYHLPFVFFSIHASAKEATIVPTNVSSEIFVFNPRLREGGDKRRETKVG